MSNALQRAGWTARCAELQRRCPITERFARKEDS